MKAMETWAGASSKHLKSSSKNSPLNTVGNKRYTVCTANHVNLGIIGLGEMSELSEHPY